MKREIIFLIRNFPELITPNIKTASMVLKLTWKTQIQFAEFKQRNHKSVLS